MNTFNLNLDLDKRGGVAQWVTLRQGDHNGTQLRATIYDHGTQAGGGYTCRVSIRLPGEGNEYYRETATYTNGVAVVTVDEEYAAAIVGVTEGYFELLQGDAVIASTESFGVRILRSAQDGAVPGDKYDSAIEDALAELDEATGRISQMVVDATEEYLEAHPELTTTVEDNSLTDAKLIQHGGILDRVARLWNRLDNILTATPAEADTLTVTDAAKTPMAGLALYGRSTQDGTPTPDAPVAIQSVGGNLYQQTRQAVGTTYPVSGLTFTYDSTNSATVSGTSTAAAVAAWPDNVADDTLFVHVPAGTYTATSSHNVEVKKRVGTTLTTLVTYSTQRFATFTLAEDTDILVVPVLIGNRVDFTGTRMWACLFAGSVPSVGVPYGNVGLWAQGANLSPFFSVPIAAGGYWSADSANWTSTSDGWARFDFDNTSSSAANRDVIIYPQQQFHAGQRYTLLFEWRGVTVSGSSGSQLYTRTDDTYQFKGLGGNNIAIEAGSGNTSRTVTCALDAEDATRMLGLRMRVVASTHVTGEWRVSIYKGEYAGDYQPYVESVTPIDLQGHALRSLPDGTRDEVTVDQYGHAVLTQRVASATFSGASSEGWEVQSGNGGNRFRVTLSGLVDGSAVATDEVVGYLQCDHFKTVCDSKGGNAGTYWGEVGISARRNNLQQAMIYHEGETLAEWQTWLASNPITINYKLATPVTIDLGTVDPVALQGPDMTAHAVPTAPFALTYERDLNVTLARLEAAIAEVATS